MRSAAAADTHQIMSTEALSRAWRGISHCCYHSLHLPANICQAWGHEISKNSRMSIRFSVALYYEPSKKVLVENNLWINDREWFKKNNQVLACNLIGNISFGGKPVCVCLFPKAFHFGLCYYFITIRKRQLISEKPSIFTNFAHLILSLQFVELPVLSLSRINRDC